MLFHHHTSLADVCVLKPQHRIPRVNLDSSRPRPSTYITIRAIEVVQLTYGKRPLFRTSTHLELGTSKLGIRRAVQRLTPTPRVICDNVIAISDHEPAGGGLDQELSDRVVGAVIWRDRVKLLP